jgi:hypothetical protein
VTAPARSLRLPVARRRPGRPAGRTVGAFAGATLVGAGAAMVLLPGPGLVLVVAGLALLVRGLARG